MDDDLWIVRPLYQVGFSAICNEPISFNTPAPGVELDQDDLPSMCIVGEPYLMARKIPVWMVRRV